nr:J domain-containing protein [Alcanivorax sp.]
MERAFSGFAALPSSAAANASAWWAVLGVTQGAEFDAVRAAYQQKRKSTHPDHGGTTEQFKAVQQAWRQFQEQYDECN